MKAIRFFSMAAAALILGACSNEESVIEAGQPAQPEGIPFTATISMGGASTRTTLSEDKDGSNKDILNVVWKENDKVELIYQVAGVTKTATANVDDVNTSTGIATISTTLDENTTDGTAVTLRYPASSLNATTHDFDPAQLKTQAGTLADLGAYDWREGSGTLTGTGTTATLSDNVKMESKVAIWKLSPKVGGSAINAKRFYIKNASGDVLAGTASAIATSNTVYLALQPFTSQTISMEAGDVADGYEFSKTGVTLAENTYYQSEVTMTANPSSKLVPLTLEARADGTIFVEAKFTLSYSVNGGASVEIPAGTNKEIDVTTGQKVSFYSTNPALAKEESSVIGSTNIIPNIQCYVYGNVMSLIDDGGSGFANDNEISADIALCGLFANATNLINHPTKRILLPATTLASRCYEMMFFNCSSLTTAPDLPATTLVNSCYSAMFLNCSSLNYVKCLATNVSADNCLNSWLNGVSATGTFVKASSATWPAAGSYGIPATGWTITSE